MPQSREIGLLVGGDVGLSGNLGDIRVTKDVDETWVDEISNLFVLASALALPEVAEVIHRANKRKHLRGLLIEQKRDPNWVTTMLDRAGVRTLRHTLVHHDPQVFERILNAWRIGAEEQLIADATVQDELLLVKNCALDTIEVGVTEFDPLQRVSTETRTTFHVAADGAHLHWPDLDVHLDLESIRAALDPGLRERMKAERVKSDARIGQAIRSLRNEAGLRQKDIPSISARQVRRIEKGETTPRTASLREFANAHGLELNDYLSRLAERIQQHRSAEAAE